MFGDLFRRGNPDARHARLRGIARLAPVNPLFHLKIAGIVDGQPGRGVEKKRFTLRLLEPDSPLLVAVLVAENIALGIAEDHVKQPRNLLPDDADIGLPGAVERDREQDLVLGFEDRDSDGMNAPNAFDRVGQYAGEFVFESARAAGVQGAQHPLDARLVGHRIQGRHQPFFDRCEDSEVRCARQIARLDQ